MNYRRSYRNRTTGLSAVENMGLINTPTIAPVVGTPGQGLPVVQTDPYFAIRIDTNGLTGPTKIVLFDPSQLYQLNESYAMPVGVGITGLTSDYQGMLNDLAHHASYVDLIKMTVSDDDVALTQYARPLEIYQGSKGSRPRLVKTLHPDMGVHEGQFQKGINSFTAEVLFDSRTALVFTQEPNIVTTIGLYQKAEVGRKQ